MREFDDDAMIENERERERMSKKEKNMMKCHREKFVSE